MAGGGHAMLAAAVALAMAASMVATAATSARLSFGAPVSLGPRWAENTASGLWSPEPGVLAMPFWEFGNASCATTCAAATCKELECADCLLLPCRPFRDHPYAISTDNGASFALKRTEGLAFRRTGTDAAGHTADAVYGNATLDPQVDARWGGVGGLAAPAWGGKDLGLLLPDATNTSWTSAAGSRARYAYVDGELTVTPTGDAVTLRGLPVPAIESAGMPSMLLRIDSSTALTLPDGTRLLTALASTTPLPAAHRGHRPTCPWCKLRNPSNIALFTSPPTDDGTHFEFRSWVATANATEAFGAQEGPNEHSMVFLPAALDTGSDEGSSSSSSSSKGGRLVVAFRQDAGDGWGGRYGPYMWTTSDDLGQSWAPPVPMNSTGCASPRLLLTGAKNDTLIMSGGRNDQSQALPIPSRGVQVWSVAAADIAAAAPGTAPQWQVHDISYYHNLRRNASEVPPQLPFTGCVNTSHVACQQTPSYTYLSDIGGGSALLAYTMAYNYNPGTTQAQLFAMRIDVQHS
jgi:hypothetical protein